MQHEKLVLVHEQQRIKRENGTADLVTADTGMIKVQSTDSAQSRRLEDSDHVQYKQFYNCIKDLYEAKAHSDKMTFSPIFPKPHLLQFPLKSGRFYLFSHH